MRPFKRRVLVSGSLAYDRIFTYPKRFRDALIPEKIHMINVSFSVTNVSESFGGTAGNIACTLAMLGVIPVVLGSVGNDFGRYLTWMKKNEIGADDLKVVGHEQTSSFTVITDRDDNQIGAFHAGALISSSVPTAARLNTLMKQSTYAVIAPGNIVDMLELAKRYRAAHVPYLFDPGQMLTMMSASQFSRIVRGAHGFISNDYELSLALKLFGKPFSAFVSQVSYIITTRGPRGSRLHEGTTSYKTVAPVPPKEVVDPTGAGDAYRAGLIAGIIAGKTFYEAACWGSVASAYTVEREGTQTHRFNVRDFRRRYHRTFSSNH